MNRFTTSDGLSLAYTDSGSGVPVLCLAGLTRNHEDFDPLIAARPGACRYICLDARGRGASDFAKDPVEYSVPVEARDVLELMDHLGLSSAAILGTSRGGLLALAIAAVAPERLTGVLFNDVGPDIDLAGLEAILAYIGRPPPVKTHEEMAMGLAKLSEGTVTGLSHEDWVAASKRAYTQTAEGLALRYDPGLREGVAAAVANPEELPDLWPVYALLADKPVAVLRGEHSNILTAETFARMAAEHPGLIAAVVPGRGHVPFLDEPDALRVFDTWIERLAE
ncbi:MAG: alpha/beta hydrolase [Pseudomonadota bacterium]